MKRIKRITADDGRTKIEITIKVSDGQRYRMTRDDRNTQIEGLTSKIMPVIPETKYTYLTLSNVRVK